MPKRPTLVIAEPEPIEALPVRKLVLETAKFNVLTAHSTREAMDIFESFPNISAIIVLEDAAIDYEMSIATGRGRTLAMPVIVLFPKAIPKSDWGNLLNTELHHIGQCFHAAQS
jgi:hypothetical protein